MGHKKVMAMEMGISRRSVKVIHIHVQGVIELTDQRLRGGSTNHLLQKTNDNIFYY